MNWTKEKPSSPGLYWYRSGNGDEGDWNSDEPFIVELCMWPSGLRVSMISSEMIYDLSDSHGKFAGPVTLTDDAVRQRAIIQRLTEPRPMIASEVDGSLSCFFCGEYSPDTNERHRPNCAYVEAKRITLT
jgi:hypothetical protein